jgi:type IV pilus assembly protein PilC
MFSSQLPLGALVEFCRGVRYTLESGLTLAQAMKTQSKKGPRAVRPVAARMAERLAEGDSLYEVLQAEKKYFPPLFLSISAVAEETGKLPEALRELEEYFRFQQELWKKFLSQITWPVIQFCMAIFVITLLILILGWIGGDKPFITVMGLAGPSGAVKFLGIIIGSLVVLTVGYFGLRTVLKQGHLVDAFLLKIPVLGTTLRTLAISRFCLSMAITVEAGTPIEDTVDLSLKATSNHAFASQAQRAHDALKGGEPLAETLKETHLFPEEFIDIVDTAESGGREPEMFQKQADLYHEDALLKIRLLAQAASFLVWGMVAVFIIFFIAQIFMQIAGMYDKAASGNLDFLK